MDLPRDVPIYGVKYPKIKFLGHEYAFSSQTR